MLLFVSGCFLGGIIGHSKGVSSCPQCPEIASDTVIFSDTTNISGSDDRPNADSLISADSIPYPVPYPIYLPGDTICEHDTVYVYLPYEHRLYSVPDTLDVWYSGVDACIDSAKVYGHTVTITNTVTVKEPCVEQRNMVGMQAGSQDASMLYMRKLGNRLWLGASAGYTFDGQPTARGMLTVSF